MKAGDPVHPIWVAAALVTVVLVVILFSKVGVFQPSDELAYGISRNRPQVPVVTWSEFEQLKRGMVEARAVRIIGAPEGIRSRKEVDGSEVESLTWFNPNGSSVTLSFRDGRLVEIDQSGLSAP